MKNSMNQKISWLGLCGAALFLGACMTSTEDLPIDPIYQNTQVDARVAGQTLSESFSQGKDWENTMTTPKGMETFGNVSTKVATLKKQSALLKQSDIDIGDGLHANLDDTAASKGGFATLYSETKMILVNIKDTAIVRWDDQARDNFKDNEHHISWIK